MPGMQTFYPHPDFDGKSYSPTCPVTGLSKQGPALGKQAHEVDEFILRGPEIVAWDSRGQYSVGHFDVRAEAIRLAAEEYLGMVRPERYEEVREAFHASRVEVERLETEVESLRAQVRAMTLQNAEQVVQIEGYIAEIEDLYEESYGEEAESIADVLASEDILP